jgi:hypothetical protein
MIILLSLVCGRNLARTFHRQCVSGTTRSLLMTIVENRTSTLSLPVVDSVFVSTRRIEITKWAD